MTTTKHDPIKVAHLTFTNYNTLHVGWIRFNLVRFGKICHMSSCDWLEPLKRWRGSWVWVETCPLKFECTVHSKYDANVGHIPNRLSHSLLKGWSMNGWPCQCTASRKRVPLHLDGNYIFFSEAKGDRMGLQHSTHVRAYNSIDIIGHLIG